MGKKRDVFYTVFYCFFFGKILKGCLFFIDYKKLKKVIVSYANIQLLCILRFDKIDLCLNLSGENGDALNFHEFLSNGI